MTEIHETIKTQKLEICDPAGNCVIMLGSWAKGQPYASLYDANGLERLVLALDDNGHPQIGLLDRDGKTIVGIGMSDELGSGINVFDRSGELKMILRVDPQGVPSIKSFQPKS